MTNGQFQKCVKFPENSFQSNKKEKSGFIGNSSVLLLSWRKLFYLEVFEKNFEIGLLSFSFLYRSLP